jgi:hypothetical protein
MFSNPDSIAARDRSEKVDECSEECHALRDFACGAFFGGFGFAILLRFDCIAELTGNVVDGREMEVGDIGRVNLLENGKVVALNGKRGCNDFGQRDGRCRLLFARIDEKAKRLSLAGPLPPP